MFKLNDKVRVKDVTKYGFHQGKIGYFQFFGGPDADVAVLTEQPVSDVPQGGYNVITYFAVQYDEIEHVYDA